ncbi:MAG: cation-transporting P-type ATPase [Pseudomonadales bacterium]|nr:cation-transporting P-type ATPase [Pseudomonadales bacterium]
MSRLGHHARPGAVRIAHARVPGRVRLLLPSLRGAPQLARRLEGELCGRDGIRSAAANPLTGGLLIHHDGAWCPERLVAAVSASLGVPRVRPVPSPVVVAAPRAPARAAALPGRDDGWHALSAAETLARLDATAQGLAGTAAAQRLAEYGANALPVPPRRSDLSILLGQFTGLPILLLGASAGLSLATGGVADALAIAAVLLLNGGIGFVTERQAERTISGLDAAVPERARARRDGAWRDLPADALVPGDVVWLRAGHRVPADGRLLAAAELTVDESALTGESQPVAKDAAALLVPEMPLAERINRVYKGSAVTGGDGLAVVVATGAGTEIGTIQALAGAASAPQTPLQQQLERLGRQLVMASGAACVALFALGLLRGQSALVLLRSVISLAVAAIPEGLPMVATTTLALGVRDLKRRHISVRHLGAVETLGAVQTFCMDKTGTLTLNRMTAVALQVDGARWPARAVREHAAVWPPLLEALVLCSEVEVDGDGPDAALQGSATETALLRLAQEGGVAVTALREAWPRQALIARAEQRPWLTTLHGAADGRTRVAVKGSPLRVLELCDRWRRADGSIELLDDAAREQVAAANEALAGDALRVLAVAEGDTEAQLAGNGLIWLGLVGLADPLRPGMRELIAQFHGAGIATAMITGDQSATAFAIARELDLAAGGEVQILDSAALTAMEPELLAALAPRTQVFARVSPAHKLAIVQALQRCGRVVAMTGDGVNDSPAMKAAQIGIAMGDGGSPVARSVADVVIEDDELRTLIEAIRGGRSIYANIRKALHYLLATNLSEIEITLAAVALGLPAPLSSLQLLWLNLASDILPALGLALEAPEPDVMRRPPRDPAEPILTGADYRRLLRESLAITGGALGVYLWALRRAPGGAQSLTFMTLTLAQLLHALVCRSDRRLAAAHLPPNPALRRMLAGSLAVQLALPYLPGLRGLLGLTAPRPLDWAVIAAGAGLPMLLNEFFKPVVAASQPATPATGGVHGP